MLCSSVNLAILPRDWENEKRGPGKQELGKQHPWKACWRGSLIVGAVQSCAPSMACSDTVLRVCVALEKGMRGRERARALVNCERENQMRRDNCFHALLLLNKSALQVGRKDFFFFFFGCYLLKRTGERRAVWVDD